VDSEEDKFITSVEETINKMKLIRNDTTPDNTGIFGVLYNSDGIQIAVTLERLFNESPKILSGTYTCELGTFTLEGYPPAQYYQLLDVPNCTDILIHFANYTYQLNGCIAVGEYCTGNMITNSDKTFKDFMESLDGVKSFQLEVI
jgi:hypothetical protein